MKLLIADRTLRAHIGCSATTWWLWRKQGRLPPSLKIGRRYYFYEEDVEKWIQDRKAETALLDGNSPQTPNTTK